MNRRGFLAGLGGIIAAPAIVRVASIMPVRSIRVFAPFPRYSGYDVGCVPPGSIIRFSPTFVNIGTATIQFNGGPIRALHRTDA